MRAAHGVSAPCPGTAANLGASRDGELVFGERRLRACRDILGWTEIDVRFVDVSSILAGEFTENEMRKQFTPSERRAIMDSIERKQCGGAQIHLADLPNALSASKLAGFGSRRTADNVAAVVKRGIPERIAAMDRAEIAIDAAALIAKQPPAQQQRLLRMPPARRAAAVKNLGYRQARREAPTGRRHRTVSIPWSAKPAVTTLIERWPASLLREFHVELDRRLAAFDRPDAAA